MSFIEDSRFHEHIRKTALGFNVPSLAVAYVDLKHNDVSSKGFTTLPINIDNITESSVFQIASNTKLFTVVAYGILVEAGKCRWDSKLRELIPELHLLDTRANETLTIEEILSHQSGISGYVFSFDP